MASKNKFTLQLSVFCVVVFVCLFSPSVFRLFSKRVFSEFQAPIDYISSQISDIQTYWSIHSKSKKSLIEAGRDLARMNANFQTKNIENESLKKQIDRYEKIFDMPSYIKYKSEVARVVKRDINAWWQTLTIRKGQLDGIRLGYAVIYSGGAVGRVSKVNLYTSEVELLSNRHFRMVANVQGDDRPIIYQGGGSYAFDKPLGMIKDVPIDIQASAKEPLLLYTSDLGGSFPAGIYIGKVEALDISVDEIFKFGQVELRGDLSTIKEVSVLIPVENIDD